MDTDHRAAELEPLLSNWKAFAGRAAVGIGAATAVMALANGVAPSRASLRGGLAWAAVVVLSRVCELLFVKLHVPGPEPEEPSESGDGEDPEGGPGGPESRPAAS